MGALCLIFPKLGSDTLVEYKYYKIMVFLKGGEMNVLVRNVLDVNGSFMRGVNYENTGFYKK